jgi:hypothetical protein
MVSKKDNHKNNRCQEPGCFNRCEHRICNTCASRRKRNKNPLRYAYETLRNNVYRRKGRAFFYLTFEEFKQYAIETEYMGKKGITKKGFHIDCKDPTMGYFIGNIRPLTNTLNNQVRYKKLHYEWDDETGRMRAYVTTTQIEQPENLPF